MNQKSMKPELAGALPWVEAITTLMFPLVEGVLHDLDSGTIAAICNNFSKRRIGDKSPLKEFNVPCDSYPDLFPIYSKTNWDGKPLKCISITIRNSLGKAVGLACLNCDVSRFADLERFASLFLKMPEVEKHPIESFQENWQEQIERVIQGYLYENKLTVKKLSRQQKQRLVLSLAEKGIFHLKKAPQFVSQYLDISRATLYNYLKSEIKS